MVPRVATKCVAIVALKPKENDESSVANASFIGVVSFNVKNVIVTSKSAHANELDGETCVFFSLKQKHNFRHSLFKEELRNSLVLKIIVPKIQHIPPEEKPSKLQSEPATFPPKVFSVKFQYLVNEVK